jgi:hypothetical protein
MNAAVLSFLYPKPYCSVFAFHKGNYEEVRRAVHECANNAGKTVHIDQNHCWTYMPIQSPTGVNIEPKMETKKKGFKGMMSR